MSGDAMAPPRELIGVDAQKKWYDDQPDTKCPIGGACSKTEPDQTTGILIPPDRGLCVGTGGVAQQCWDACNLEHHPLDYSSDANTREAIAIMVKQFRTGFRVDSCQGAMLQATCYAGDRCTPPGLTLYRGMCVATKTQGNLCLDMCDTSIPLDTFHDSVGKQAGTLSTVQQVRGGRDPQGYTTCPGASVWVWLWIPILLCCLLGFCALAYWMFQYYRGRLKKYSKKDRMDTEQPFVQDDVPYGNYDQAMPQPDPMPVMDQQMPVLEMDPGQMEPILDQTNVEMAPQAAAPDLVPIMEPVQGGSIFGQPPLLMGTPQPVTVMPPGYGYSQAGSMAMSNPMMSGYAPGPYGAYGGVTTYPTTSMRVG